jgi:hypothetical protein
MEGEKPYTLASSLAWLLNYLKKEERNKAEHLSILKQSKGFPEKARCSLNTAAAGRQDDRPEPAVFLPRVQ